MLSTRWKNSIAWMDETSSEHQHFWPRPIKGTGAACRAPYLAKVILGAGDACDLGERADGRRIVTEGMLVRRLSPIKVRQLLSDRTCRMK